MANLARVMFDKNEGPAQVDQNREIVRIEVDQMSGLRKVVNDEARVRK